MRPYLFLLLLAACATPQKPAVVVPLSATLHGVAWTERPKQPQPTPTQPPLPTNPPKGKP